MICWIGSNRESDPDVDFWHPLSRSLPLFGGIAKLCEVQGGEGGGPILHNDDLCTCMHTHFVCLIRLLAMFLAVVTIGR